MVFCSTFGGKGVILRQGLSLCSPASTVDPSASVLQSARIQVCATMAGLFPFIYPDIVTG